MTKYNDIERAVLNNKPTDYNITQLGNLIFGAKTHNATWVVVVDNTDGDAKVFKRNGVHSDRAPTCWLVAQLKGVRLYTTEDGKYILTDKDLYPTKELIKDTQEGKFNAIHQ